MEEFKAHHGQDEFDEYTAAMLKDKLKVCAYPLHLGHVEVKVQRYFLLSMSTHTYLRVGG